MNMSAVGHRQENNVYGIERLIISGIANFISGLAVFLGLKALGLPAAAAALSALVLAAAGVIAMAKYLPAELIGIRKQKPWLCTFWLATSLISILLIVRLSVFMYEPSLTQYSLFPNDQWYIEHCCLTAYSEAAILTETGEDNIYDLNNYLETSDQTASQDRLPFRKVAGFKVDLYHYPPTFLLLPFTARAVTGGDFLNLRMLWFAIGVLSLMTAIGFIIYRLGSEGRIRMIGMAPLIWCSLPVLAGLQMSNVQIIVISISIIAMALFPLSRPAGGILLAMSSVAKIFPGILVVYLLAQRKFREVLWAAGFALALTITAFIVAGPDPFQAFINYELPRLSSGEAFSRPLSREFAVARNMSPFGIPVKLNLLGVSSMTLETGRMVSLLYLVIVLILAVWAGRQKPRNGTEAVSVWLALISLGTLVSPFAPSNYVLVSLVILVCLNRELFPLRSVIIIWLIISAPFFITQQAPFLFQALCYLPAQITALAIPGWVLYRAGLRTAPEQKQVLQTIRDIPE